MSAANDLPAAITWLQSEIARLPYGKIGITVQMHGGQVIKIFKNVEESFTSNPADSGRDHHENRTR